MEPRTRLPSVDRLLRDPAFAPIVERHGRGVVTAAIRSLQAQARAAGDATADVESPTGWARRVDAAIEAHWGRGLVPVFNVTGTLLHTNLGRAAIGDRLAAAGLAAATTPVTLEYDLTVAARGDRDRLIEPLVSALTGAEAATVVNNNAAAVLLTLTALARGREVPVSRGELIEIGGSFRIPDVIERAGCRIREVGTTNRTHLRDYEAVIGEDTAVLLKVHPSNYRIDGFTRAVPVGELAQLARERGIPLIVDLGSGALIDLKRFGLPHEPLPGEVLAAGADLVTFSGDKLLGAAQAGFVAGRADLVARVRSDPLKRALRCDKITLAILRETLKLYQEPERAIAEIPLLRQLARPLSEVALAAERIARCLAGVLDARYRVGVIDSRCQVGSGALPEASVPSAAVCVTATSDAALRELIERLHRLPRPVLARLHDGRVLLDLRAVEPTAALEAAIAALASTS
jgi:L-seryl-tRNA(Ser) seleniumtransferase